MKLFYQLLARIDTPDTIPKVDASNAQLSNIIGAVLTIAGVIAVVFIIIGGFLYITSAGDASKIKRAKDTILYAIVGLVIAALAFAVIQFVIGVF